MSKFVVMLEGTGLPVSGIAREQLGLEHSVRSLGFFTTRVVNAPAASVAIDAAISHALEELRTGPLLNGVDIGSLGGLNIKAVQIRMVSWWRSGNAPTKGFSFYPERDVGGAHE